MDIIKKLLNNIPDQILSLFFICIPFYVGLKGAVAIWQDPPDPDHILIFIGIGAGLGILKTFTEKKMGMDDEDNGIIY